MKYLKNEMRNKLNFKRYLTCYPSVLYIGDNIKHYKMIGFQINEKNNTILINEILLKFCDKYDGRGVLGWSFNNIPLNITNIDNIPINNTLNYNNEISTHHLRYEDKEHQNGVKYIDHMVLKSNNSLNTEKELNSIGILKKRSFENIEKKMIYSFYRPNNTIIEVLGSTSSENNNVGSKIMGLTFTCQDIMATHNYLSEYTKTPWPAVQKGRFITTLNKDLLDEDGDEMFSLRIAFMSPHVK